MHISERRTEVYSKSVNNNLGRSFMFKFPLSVILALVMCFSANLSKAADEIVIGLSMVKTGFLKTPAEATETAVDIAVSEINASGGINGKKIRLVKYDTESKAKLAVVATQKFARDDGALAIIGPFSSGEAKAAFPVGERLGIVQIPNASSGPGLTKGYTYAWRLTEMEGVQFARVLKTLKKKKIDISKAEIVYISDEYVSSLVGKFVYPALFKTFKVKYGKAVTLQYKSFDVAPQVAKIIERKPNVVALAATPDLASKVMKELRRQGFKGRIIGSQLFSDPNALDKYGSEANGLIFVAGFWWDNNAKTRAFSKKYAAENAKRGLTVKKIPHHSDAQGYDIVYLLKQAMEKANVTGEKSKLKAERTAIRDALKGIRFSGITGDNVCFDKMNDAQLPGYIIEIKNLKWSKIDEWPPEKC